MQPDQLNRLYSGDHDDTTGPTKTTMEKMEKIRLSQDDEIDLERQRAGFMDGLEKTNLGGLALSSSPQDLLLRNPKRNQFKKLSDVVCTISELHSIDPTTPNPPEAIAGRSGVVWDCLLVSRSQFGQRPRWGLQETTRLGHSRCLGQFGRLLGASVSTVTSHGVRMDRGNHFILM